MTVGSLDWPILTLGSAGRASKYSPRRNR